MTEEVYAEDILGKEAVFVASGILTGWAGTSHVTRNLELNERCIIKIVGGVLLFIGGGMIPYPLLNTFVKYAGVGMVASLINDFILHKEIKTKDYLKELRASIN